MKTSKSSRPLCHRGRGRTRRPAADTSRTASPLDVNSSLLTAADLPVRPAAQPGTTPHFTPVARCRHAGGRRHQSLAGEYGQPVTSL